MKAICIITTVSIFLFLAFLSLECILYPDFVQNYFVTQITVLLKDYQNSTFLLEKFPYFQNTNFTPEMIPPYFSHTLAIFLILYGLFTLLKIKLILIPLNFIAFIVNGLLHFPCPSLSTEKLIQQFRLLTFGSALISIIQIWATYPSSKTAIKSRQKSTSRSPLKPTKSTNPTTPQKSHSKPSPTKTYEEEEESISPSSYKSPSKLSSISSPEAKHTKIASPQAQAHIIEEEEAEEIGQRTGGRISPIYGVGVHWEYSGSNLRAIHGHGSNPYNIRGNSLDPLYGSGGHYVVNGNHLQNRYGGTAWRMNGNRLEPQYGNGQVYSFMQGRVDPVYASRGGTSYRVEGNVPWFVVALVVLGIAR